ncbi:hypothetical protein SEA_NICEHOUSE_261 [Rhodococcus phage NiceHouse]|nr:hypothetical protein SEA_NICEHOUSE_261 [Rhodococcus phage NiceHouse]
MIRTYNGLAIRNVNNLMLLNLRYQVEERRGVSAGLGSSGLGLDLNKIFETVPNGQELITGLNTIFKDLIVFKPVKDQISFRPVLDEAVINEYLYNFIPQDMGSPAQREYMAVSLTIIAWEHECVMRSIAQDLNLNWEKKSNA